MFKKNSITQGDSLELLRKIPDKSIDLIFADPPYNLQLRETLYRPDQTTVEAVTNDWDKFDTYQAYDELLDLTGEYSQYASLFRIQHFFPSQNVEI